MKEDDSNRLAVLGIRFFQHIEQFLLEHIKSANLQRKGKVIQAKKDFKIASNKDFWALLLSNAPVALKWIELDGFQIVDWFPRSPGLYHTKQAIRARDEADNYLQDENGILFYEPRGKTHMIEGGVGSIRFKPIKIEGHDLWLCTATSDGYCHSGIPLAIPNLLMEKFNSQFASYYKVVGQVHFLPEFLEQHFIFSSRIPQIYILVDKLERIGGGGIPAKITPMVLFTAGKISNLHRRENVTYVSCYPDSTEEIDRAADWIKWYVDRYEGEIITDFDQQRPAFSRVPFSIDNVMSGKINTNYLHQFQIDHAEIIVDSIQNIHAEAVAMSQKIDVTIKNGATVQGNLVVAHSITSSLNTVDTIQAANDSNDIQILLKQLVDAVQEMKKAMEKEYADEVMERLETLIAESNKQKPRKQWWQLSIDEIKKAAQDVGDVGKPVLDIISKLVPILLSLSR